MKILSVDIENKIRFLGYYQILGGVWGLFQTIRLLIYESTLSGLGLLFYSLALLLFIFSIYCGNLLRKRDKKGLFLSTWHQLLQLFQVSISSVSFAYYSGINFSFGFHWVENFVPDFKIALSAWHFRYTESQTDYLSVFINIIPIIIIYHIRKIEREIEERKKFIDEAKNNNI